MVVLVALLPLCLLALTPPHHTVCRCLLDRFEMFPQVLGTLNHPIVKRLKRAIILWTVYSPRGQLFRLLRRCIVLARPMAANI